MAFKLFKNGVAPIRFLSIATLLMLLSIAYSAWYSVHTPWLGIKVATNEIGQLEVLSIYPKSPAANQLATGDILASVITASGQSISLNNYNPTYNPHAASTYEDYNNYMAWQGQIYQALSQPSITFTTQDQKNITLNPASKRPVASLPIDFWLIGLFGLLACLISLSVWIFQPSQWPARLLAISGSSFFLATWQQTFWETRELALPFSLFELLMRGNHIFMHLLLIALMVMMMIYPRKLTHSRWLIIGLVSFYVLQQVNENLQLWLPPFHAFYIFLLIYYALGVYLTVSQWRLSRFHPTDRGALRWVFLTILLAMGGGMLVYFLPTVVGLPPLGGLTAMVGIASTLYVGFALGILRYKLFQIERWWFITWVWFLGGLSVLTIDLLVVFAFQLPEAYALSLSLLLVGWLYFPLRQWFWRRISSHRQLYLESYLPSFVETLFTSSAHSLPNHWKNALDKAFHPLSIDNHSQTISQPKLTKNGASLLVPSFDPNVPALKLFYAHKGRHLFNRRDLAMANALSSIATRICNLRDARQQGATEERKRIMRDLHDDVGGRLLTLIQTANSESQETLARNALGALRETIYALDESSRYHLEDLIASFRTSLNERLGHSALTPQVHIFLAQDDVELLPRYFINICRVLDEALTNAINHSAAGTLKVTFNLHNNQLTLQLHNPIGHTPSNSGFFRGRGLSNMQTRINELNGDITLLCLLGSPHVFCLEATIPIPNTVL